MKLLVDSVALVWWTTDPARLSAAATRALRKGQNDLLVSAATAYELLYKKHRGRLHVASPLGSTFESSLRRRGFTLLDLTTEHMVVAAALADPHPDPFDRMLAAQAIVEGMPVVTNDAAIARLGAAVVW
ncbi:MAG: type II toxin-antitoxin system VapC family toxin [Gemmatimonadales bacterium]|nr:type II toxin-antitoxin system VapC family toxin [Gemmatimonadales bacterium]